MLPHGSVDVSFVGEGMYIHVHVHVVQCTCTCTCCMCAHVLEVHCVDTCSGVFRQTEGERREDVRKGSKRLSVVDS